MKVHEYQAKELFRAAGIPVPREKVASTPAEAAAASREIGLPVVIKAQVLVGGRGKAGGVKKVEKQEDVELTAGQVLGMDIKGLTVKKVLVAECVDVKKEYYVGIIVDRSGRKPVLIASAAGGVEIEQVARETPEKILKVSIDPGTGVLGFQGRNVGMALFGDAKLARSFADIVRRLYGVFVERDCSLVEINPLVLQG